ncbi:hypothetical protein [Rhodococcus sp. O3]
MTTTDVQDLGPAEAEGPEPARPRTTGAGFSTAEIKARIEAMFADHPEVP